MKSTIKTVILVSLVTTFAATAALAVTCDQYPGDNWIYGGLTSSVKPNVMIIIDTSLSMSDSVPGTAIGGGTTLVPKIDIARDVVKNLISSTTGVNFGVMIYNNGNGSKGQSKGSRFFDYTVSGTSYTTTIKDMDAIYSGTKTNRDALLASINTTTVIASGYTPLAESLYEAGQYFRGGESAFDNTVGLSGTPAKYTSPITASCQKNYIVFVTDGMSTSDNTPVLNSICPSSRTKCQGDYDGDGVEPSDMSHAMDDVAKYLYDTDLLPDETSAGKEYTIGKQNISTFTIGFGDVGADAQAVALLQSTADDTHGHGAPYLAADQSGLSLALKKIISSILSVDTSFVAPVMPVSPENRTYSSSRVYMGFFKPVDQSYWKGNLKKYALDSNNNIKDKNGNFANWVDANGNGIDDNTGEALPSGAINGSFRNTSVSYWNTVVDAEKINSGGVGDLLLSRDFVATPRKLYTYTGTNAVLTDASNDFSKANSVITATTLNVANAAKDKLIDFIYGIDTYDENANGNITEKRGWIFGDILHSKPLAVNYTTYPMTAANEGNCTVNKSVIYVGSNDGMLHAIKDCDGSEAWAFIPPEVLGNLKEIPEQIHTYMVDSSPSVYIYDKNNNGIIETTTDRVVMMIGMRRGGAPNSAPTKGSYYLLDVTDPAAPKYLWSLSNNTPGFFELAESWAEPKITRLKIGAATKIAAFIGGGYDNMNEDNRYGATMTFSGTGTISNTASGTGNTTSAGSSVQSNPKGRALYAVEIATLSNDGVPSFTNSGTKIWGVSYGSTTSYAASPATDSGMTYAITADVAMLDVDGNGYADRLYVADLGGNLWRFDVGSSNVAAWTGNKIFSANPATGDTGRKVFYKPAVTLEASITEPSRGNDALVFMGSGDREHPLNTAVFDGIYAIRDKGQLSAAVKTESNLLDVTTDQLQASTNLSTVAADLKTLSTNYGWYIKLNQNLGEKVLASPTVFNKVAYLTTFTPGTSNTTDPCKPSNLGISRLYALNYATGEAVLNYDRTNDSTTTTNQRAQSRPGGEVLLLSDRLKTIGSGIPSGVVLVVNPGGGTKALIGCGGAICPENTVKGGSILNLYWGQK